MSVLGGCTSAPSQRLVRGVPSHTVTSGVLGENAPAYGQVPEGVDRIGK